MADSWGGSWGTSWALSWGSSTPPAPTLVLLGGKDYPASLPWASHTPYETLKEEEYQKKIAEKRAELRRIDEEITEAEKQRQIAEQRSKAKLAAKNAVAKQTAREKQLQDEINRLRIERAELMRMIDDEEAILVLLLSWPLH